MARVTDVADSKATCRVLLADLQPKLLHSLVEMLLATRPGVEVLFMNPSLDFDDVDLVIEGIQDVTDIPRLAVSVNGTATRMEIAQGELSQRVLDLALAAARGEQPARAWFEVLVEACRRFDDLVEKALESARSAYDSGGGFSEWREAFGKGQTDFGGQPLSSLRSSALLGADPAEAIPADSPIGRLISGYNLTGQEVDVLLACLMNELDGRYTQRYAYLIGESGVVGPTTDVLAALLCSSVDERLALLADLVSGTLVSSGLVTRSPAGVPIRSQVIALDRTVLRTFLTDDRPDPGDVILDPTLTARAVGPGPQSSGTDDVIRSMEDGEIAHVHGGVEADRRSRALDLAAALNCRLIAVPWTAFSQYDDHDAHKLRRDCIRMNVRCVVEGVPRDLAEENLRRFVTARVAVTTGPVALRSSGPARIRNDEVRRPTLPQRRVVWKAAADWAGASPTDGLESLAQRFGVSLDRAADVLTAAASEHASFTTRQVGEMLSQNTMDDAGGLLHALQPRASFSDLVLADETRRELADAKNRIANRDLVIDRFGWNQMTDRLTGTYLMFAGPPGTGKTIAAEALANELGLPVQLLEISALFSRWVGDFEEHVDRVFAAAQASGALLVVNEADAILGPRTEVLHGQDRYANAGTSHILSRLEQFTGHVVFTTNLLGANNIDPAFHRRITAIVRFHQPDLDQRVDLWRSVWPTSTRDGGPVELLFQLGTQTRDAYFRDLAAEHPLSGGSIANIARSATFLAAARNPEVLTITDVDLRQALAQELTKIGDFRSLTKVRVPA